MGLNKAPDQLTPLHNDAVRTLAQLECPTSPGEVCGSPRVRTYLEWSEKIWYFGDERTLPVLSALSFPTTPLELKATWPSSSTLRLTWGAPTLGNVDVEYQVEIPALDISSKTRSTFFDVSGDDLKQLREGVGRSMSSFSVQGSNHFDDEPGPTAVAEVRLLDVPGPPSTLSVTWTMDAESSPEALITFEHTDNDGYGRDSGDKDFGEPAGSLELELGYFVVLYEGDEKPTIERIPLSASEASPTVTFLALAANRDYRVVVRAENVVGASSTIERIFGSPPVISDTPVGELVYGASSVQYTLRASAPYASSLVWSLVTAPKRDNSTVYLTTTKGGEAEVIYEVLAISGIILDDEFTVRVEGPTGFDTTPLWSALFLPAARRSLFRTN